MSLQRLRVMVVDDNPMVAGRIADMLSEDPRIFVCDRVESGLLAFARELLSFAGSNKRAGHRCLELLRAAPDDLAARRRGQLIEFRQGILEIPKRPILEFCADEEDAFRRHPCCFD